MGKQTKTNEAVNYLYKVFAVSMLLILTTGIILHILQSDREKVRTLPESTDNNLDIEGIIDYNENLKKECIEHKTIEKHEIYHHRSEYLLDFCIRDCKKINWSKSNRTNPVNYNSKIKRPNGNWMYEVCYFESCIEGKKFPYVHFYNETVCTKSRLIIEERR